MGAFVMQIDRARFLLLTASLAGGGCSANPTTSGPSAPPAPTTTETGTEVVVPEVPETTTDSTSDTASASTSSTTSDTATQVATGPCDNDTGTVAACSIKAPPGPYCESFQDTKATCKTYKTALRAGVAAKAVACLNAASGTPDICDFSKTEKCASEAIRAACVQPSTFNACSPVVSACAPNSWSKLTMNDCQALLSAVKDGKRQSMITCMTEGCSLESCTWMLR